MTIPMTIPPLDLQYRPQLPAKSDYGIGIIGCGGIVNYAHLPAYRAHNLRILACYDVDVEAARKTAAEHGIPTIYESLDELLCRQAHPDRRYRRASLAPAPNR